MTQNRHIPLVPGTKCYECGQEAHVNHHIIPYSQGGRAVVALCNMHHDIVHGLKRNWSSELIKIALAKTRLNGTRLGAPKKFSRNTELQVIEEWFKTGKTTRQLSIQFNISTATVCRILKAAKK